MTTEKNPNAFSGSLAEALVFLKSICAESLRRRSVTPGCVLSCLPSVWCEMGEMKTAVCLCAFSPSSCVLVTPACVIPPHPPHPHFFFLFFFFLGGVCPGGGVGAVALLSLAQCPLPHPPPLFAHRTAPARWGQVNSRASKSLMTSARRSPSYKGTSFPPACVIKLSRFAFGIPCVFLMVKLL